MIVELSGIAKSFGPHRAVRGVDVRIADGEFTALLGPSGSGKTTLLRIIAGLETPDAGAVRFDGEDVTRVDVRQRRVGFVFQHYALFRNMTVFDNVAFGLTVKPSASRPKFGDIRDRVFSLLKRVRLEEFATRRPDELSGGQRQRVALARALAVDARILLLDEPFGALEANVRRDLRRWLRELHDELGITTVLVTHDQEEAFEVADRVVLLNEGKVEQAGTPGELYDRPATPFVCRFLGRVNEFPDGLLVRPHDLEVTRHPTDDSAYQGTIRQVREGGPLVRIRIEVPGLEHFIDAELPNRLNLRVGEAVHIRVKKPQVFQTVP